MPQPQLDIDFAAPEVMANPFPAYEAVRAAGRVVWNGKLDAWMVTAFEDCTAVLSDARGDRFRQVNDPEVVFWFDADNMITVDGAEHHRLRGCLVPYFTRRAVAKWEPRIREVVRQLLAPLVRDQAFALDDFTMIPTVIVAEMMGVPEERHEDFRRWSNAVTNNVAFGHEAEDTRRRMKIAVAELNSYLTEEIERHRRGDFDDLLSVMLTMSDMSDAEMRSTAVNLLLAGYDTTAKLMSMCLVALVEHPDQRIRVVEDPSLVPGMIEEVLRWEGVPQMLPRVVARDVEFGGTALTAGEMIYPIISAGNRDPQRWPDAPERFDVSREPKTNIGFGYGPHLCIGAPLARLETKVAVEELIHVAPNYRLRDVERLTLRRRGVDRESDVDTGSGLVEVGGRKLPDHIA